MSKSSEIAPYIEKVLCEQDEFRAASPSVLPRAVRSIAGPVGALTTHLIPPDVIEAAIRGADWVASASIRKAALSHDFADLEACDEAAADVRRWALGYAVTGGGAAGAFGAAGLAIDIPATVTLALRTARLTGLCYGFGGASEAERVHILDVLQLAGANSAKERSAALKRLAEGRGKFAREDWQKIVSLTGQTTGSVAATQRVATTLGVNLSTRKMAQIAPVVGAAIGAGVNAAFQNDVAAAARFSFRARWLEVNEGIVEGRTDP
ncbi:MAG: EcsC family protein [Silicimonas sp.]|nr:EcsC family protein [Silicimonas sp.]